MPAGSASSFTWGIIGLVLLAPTVFLVVVANEIPPGQIGWLGGVLVAFGALNILFHRTFGRQTFKSTRSMRSVVSNFWDRIGMGLQFLYLGIGVILALAGVFLLLRSMRS